jgi:4-amino-4-deoxy-L-arabinose transferase-like glycosyltransferase
VNTASWTRRNTITLAAVLLLAVVFGGKRATQEEAGLMLGGDMARYMMNGVFVYDFIADGGAWSFDAVEKYAERYYAQYPALSLGHHPPIPYLAAVPFYGVFGISVFAARFTALLWLLLATACLYAVVRRLYGDWPALWASLLFVTNVWVVRLGQYLWSEMPMIALVLLSCWLLLVFCRTRRFVHFVLFLFAVNASLYAKQLAIFLLPVYAVILIREFGWRRFTTRRALVLGGVAAVCIIPIVILTVALAPANVQMALRYAGRLFAGVRAVSVPELIGIILTSHLSLPALILTGTATIWLLVSRDWRVLIGLTWVVCAVGASVVFTGPVEPARYAFGALPGYAILGGSLAMVPGLRAARLAAVALAIIVGYQGWQALPVAPNGAGGYREAAEFVLKESPAPAVLYDSSVDTGYFMFFMRKLDPARAHVVLRADKMFEDNRLPFYDTLRKYGVRFIVVETRIRGHQPLVSMHAELKSPRFVERLRMPIRSFAADARGIELTVYEFPEAGPPDLDAEIHIGVPLGGRNIRVKLRDVLSSPR